MNVLPSRVRFLATTGLLALSLLASWLSSAWAIDWTSLSDGGWSTATNWNPNTTGGPTGIGITVNITANITVDRKVTIDSLLAANPIVGILNIGDASNKYTLAADTGRSLVLNNDTVAAQINVVTGSKDNTITAPITLDSSLEITNSSSGRLTIGSAATTVVLSSSGGLKTITNKIGSTGVVEIKGRIADGSGQVAVVQSNSNDIFLLSADNTFTGGVTINSGTLKISHANALGAGTLTLNGGTLDGGISGGVVATNNPQTWAGDFSVAVSSAADFNLGTGAVTLTGDRVVTTTTAGKAVIVGGVISGTGFKLTKDGVGLLVLNGDNSYDGGTLIKGGILQFGNGALPDNGSITINAGGALAATGAYPTVGDWLLSTRIVNSSAGAMALTANSNENIDFAAAGYPNLGLMAATNVSYTGTLAPTSSGYHLGGVGTLSMDTPGGAITGNNALVIDGLVTLSTANASYSGAATVNTGTLTLSAANAMGTGSLTVNGGAIAVVSHSDALQNATAITLASKGQIRLTGGVTVNRPITINTRPDSNQGSIYSLLGTNTWAGNITIAGNDARLGAPSGQTLIISGAIDGPSTYALGIRSDAADGTVVLSGTAPNTYQGATNAYSGILRIASSNRLPIATTLSLGSSTADAVFDLAGFNQEVGVLTSSVVSSVKAATIVNTGGTQSVLTINSTADSTYGHATAATTGLIGAGSLVAPVNNNIALVKKGAYTLTLNRTNTYSGPTTVDAGTLNLSSAAGAITNSSAVTVNFGGTLKLNNTATANNTNRIGDTASVILNGGTFNFSNDAGAASFMEVAGQLNLASGASTLQTSQAASGQTATLTFSALNRSSGATVNFSGAGLGTTQNKILFTTTPTLYGSLLGGWATAGSEWAKYDTVNGVAPTTVGDYTTNTEDAWTSSNLVLLTSGTTTLTGNRTIAALTFAPTSPTTLDLGGNALRVTSGGILFGVTDTGTITGTTGTLTAGAAADVPADLFLNQNSASDATIAAIVADNGTGALSLNKSGTGRLLLSGMNSYSGTTNVLGGTLAVTSLPNGGVNSPLGKSSSAAANVFLNGGALQYAGAAPASTDRAVTVGLSGGTLDASGATPDATLTFTAANPIAFDVPNAARTITLGGANTGDNTLLGVIADNGTGAVSLAKTGAGVWKLTTAQSYTGATIVSAGTLKLAGGDNRLPIASALTMNGGTLDLGGTTQTFAALTLNAGTVTNGTLAGSIGVAKTTSGTATLSGNSTYTGVTNVTAGTLVVAHNNALGSTAAGTVVAGAIQLQGGVTITDEALTINASGSGSNQLAALAGGSNINTWAGPITFNVNGILRIGMDAGTTLALTGPVTLTGVHSTGLVLQGEGTGIISGIISGTDPGSTLYRSNGGNADWYLTGENTYAGQTKLTSGRAVYIGDGGTTGRFGTGDVFTAGTIVFNRSNTLVVNNLIANYGTANGKLTQAGTGTLELTNANTYSGATTINAGTLVLSGSNNTGGTTVLNAGTLRLNNAANGGLASGQVTLNGGTLEPIGAERTLNNAIALGGSVTITGTQNLALYGAIADGAASGGLTYNGSAVLTLGNSNSYSGPTVLESGTLRLGSSAALQNSTLDWRAGTLDVGNHTSLSMGGLAGIHDFSLLNASLAPIALTLGGSNASTAYSGALSGAGASLTKIGTGVQTLSGLNTYTGGTMIYQGMVNFAASQTLPATGVVYIGNDSAAAFGFDITPAVLAKIDPTSLGTVALGTDRSTPLDLTGFPSLGLGAFGNATFSAALTLDSVATTMRLGSVGGRLTMAGAISGTLPVNIQGDAVFANDANTYGGVTTVNKGAVLGFTSIANAGAAASALGAPASGNETIYLDGTLRYLSTAPAGHSSDRPIVLTSPGTLDASGVGPWKLTNPMAAVTGSYDLTLTGRGAGEISGPIAANALIVTGGSWTLSGANSYSGATRLVGGTLMLDYATQPTVLNGWSPLELNGGALKVKGNPVGTTDQSVYSLTVAATRLGSVALDNNGGSGTTLTVGGAWAFGSGSALHFDLSHGGTVIGASAPLTNGVIAAANAARTTVKGTDGKTYFATLDVNNHVVAQTTLTPLAANSSDNTLNYETSGDLTTTTAIAVGTLRIDTTTTAGSLNLAGGDYTALNQALLVDGSHDYEIKGTGILASAVVHHYGAGALTISAPIAQGMTKDGPGLLISAMPAFPSYLTVLDGIYRTTTAAAFPVSGVRLGGGVLELGYADFTGGLGTTTGAGQVSLQGRSGFSAYGADRTVNIGGAAATMSWDNGNFLPNNSTFLLSSPHANAMLTFVNPIALGAAVRQIEVADGSAAVDAQLTGVLSGTLASVVKTGAGTLRVTAANTFGSGTTVAAGTLLVSNTSGSGTGTGPVAVANGATLGGNGSLAGATTVAGTLRPGDGSTPGTLTITSSLTFSSTANAVFDIASLTAFDKVTGVSALAYGGTLTIQGTVPAGTHDYDLFEFASFSGNFSSFSLPTNVTLDAFTPATGVVRLTATSVGPTTRYWTGASAENQFLATAGNWVGSIAPTTTDWIEFGSDGGTNKSPLNAADRTVAAVTFATGGYNLGGAAKLTVTGPVTANASATISAPLELTGAGGPVAAASGATLTVSGSVSGTQGITKTGTGTVELTAASNSYTGNTVAAEGTLKVTAGVNSNGNWVTNGDDTTVGTPAAGLDPVKVATLITEHIRQDVLTINAGSKVTISATGGASSTSVVNVLNIANSSGTFNWSSFGGDISPAATGGPVASGAAVPEPATWLLAVMAALAGLVAWRRR